MTHQEMLNLAAIIVDALRNGGFDDSAVVDHEPGEPIPIVFTHYDEQFVLDLNVL